MVFYCLDDLESKINKFQIKEVSIDILKEKFKLTEDIFMRYMGEFPDDELTEVFYNLKDAYQSIPDIESYAKNLSFKLPSIDIPVFSGKVTEWDTFRELYEQLILNQAIPKTQKMCILKTKLSGEAAKMIANLPSKDENFETAWNILVECYSNKRAITSLYFKTLLEVPVVVYNAQSVKKFTATVNESLQALGSMNIGAHEMHQAFMCFVLQRKLDDQLGNLFEQHLGNTTNFQK